MGRPLYPDQPHRTLGEQKKEEPIKEEPKVEEPKVETRVIDEVVQTTAILEPKSKKFNLKNLRKKKDR